MKMTASDTAVALELVRLTVVEYTPALRPAGFAVSVRMTGVLPLAGVTVSQFAFEKAVVNGTLVTGLLVTLTFCWTGAPPTWPFRNTVNVLTVNVFCACKVPAVLDSIKARAGTKE